MTIVLTTGYDVLDFVGETTAFRKKQLMCMAPVEIEHEIEKWGETHVGKPGVDLQLFEPGKPGDYYFCKKDLFEKTYEETECGSGLYRKAALTNAVQVPEGKTFYVQSLEAKDDTQMQLAVHPHWIAVGVENEVWVIGNDVIQKDFEAVS